MQFHGRMCRIEILEVDMLTLIMIFFSLLGTWVAFTLIGVLIGRKSIGTVLFLSTATIILVILSTYLVFKIAPKELGYGHVRYIPASFADQLENGVAYELVSTIKSEGPVSTNYVLVVRPYGTLDFRVIRTKTVPPDDVFTIINGNPEALAIADVFPRGTGSGHR